MTRRSVVIWAAALASVAVTPAAAAANQQPWTSNIFAPRTRTVVPTAVLRTTGSVTGAAHLLGGGGATKLAGQGSSVVLDFGREVGGLVTVRFAAASDAAQQLGLAFSESSLFTGPESDASNGGGTQTPDHALTTTVTAPGSYTMPAAKLRGGFRYLTLFLTTAGSVELSGASLDFTAAPTMAEPAAYPNYFYSSDSELNRIWYAGAYTVQMDTIDPQQGRVWPFPTSGWDNSATVGVGRSVLVDGAKRDRTAWPGDLGVSIPTDFAAFADFETIRNSLEVLFEHQDATGALPYAGPAVNFPGISDTYHLWTLIATIDYLQYSHDRAWLSSVWSRYRNAVAWSTSRIGPDGLFFVTAPADWARSGQGRQNIAANALLYKVLTGSADLATTLGDGAQAKTWHDQAGALRAAINAQLWDPAAGAYRDNPSSTLHPQDGNSIAVWFGVPDTPDKAPAILAALKRNWLTRGAHTPEWTGIHPFPGSMEVAARLTAGDDVDALNLIRREWGYMLNSPIGTASTFWEGYNDDGSFAYEGSGAGYTSLAHGWATGPTSALTFFVLGIEPGTGTGSWRFAPHLGDLTFVEGRITLPQGPLNARWERSRGHLTLTADVPAGTSGRVVFPGAGPVYVDGVASTTTTFDGIGAGHHVFTNAPAA
jgi:hypothetical protein